MDSYCPPISQARWLPRARPAPLNLGILATHRSADSRWTSTNRGMSSAEIARFERSCRCLQGVPRRLTIEALGSAKLHIRHEPEVGETFSRALGVNREGVDAGGSVMLRSVADLEVTLDKLASNGSRAPGPYRRGGGR